MDTAPPDSDLQLAFTTGFGRFLITSDTSGTENGNDEIFHLHFVLPDNTRHKLRDYRSLHEVIHAVGWQETGLRRWDTLPTEEVPRRVHDIMAWKI